MSDYEYTLRGWLSPNPGCCELSDHDGGGWEPVYSRRRAPVGGWTAEQALVCANREVSRLEFALLEANEELNWRREPMQKALAAGDVIAHQLLYRDHGDILERWWKARGGHEACSVCNADSAEGGK